MKYVKLTGHLPYNELGSIGELIEDKGELLKVRVGSTIGFYPRKQVKLINMRQR